MIGMMLILRCRNVERTAAAELKSWQTAQASASACNSPSIWKSSTLVVTLLLCTSYTTKPIQLPHLCRFQLPSDTPPPPALSASLLEVPPYDVLAQYMMQSSPSPPAARHDDHHQQQRRSQLLLGCVFLACTATAWVTASFLAQSLVSGDQPSLHPFLLTYVCTSMFSLYLPIIGCKRWLLAHHKAKGSSRTTTHRCDV